MKISSKHTPSLLIVLINILSSSGFTVQHSKLPTFKSQISIPRTRCILSAVADGDGQPPKLTQQEEDDLQWDFFLKHQARGKWRGTWISYDYMGDIVDSTIAR